MSARRFGALLPIAPAQAREGFAARAAQIGFAQRSLPGDLGAQQGPERLEITLVGGVLTLVPEGQATRLIVQAQDAPHVQMLRDYLTEELAAFGLVPQWQGAAPQGAQPANHALAKVVAVAQISPSFRRVTVAGAQLARFAEGGLHFRLLFGPRGAAWPSLDENGVTQWPDGAQAWHKPVYTIRALRLGPCPELEFDVFVHEGGRVSAWSAGDVLGQEVVLAGPAGGTPLTSAAWQALIGDETALPVIARMLALLPSETRGAVALFIPERADRQPLQAPAGMAVTWHLRRDPLTPLDALAALTPPAQNRAIFFAAEASEALAARNALRALGFAKTEFTAASYWSKGDQPSC